MEDAFRELLLTAMPRCYWSRAPQTPAPARPYVVLHRISAARGYTQQGQDGLVQSRIQIDVLADTYVSARATADALIAIISGYRDVTFPGVFVDAERSLPAEASDPDELYRIAVDAIVWHREPIQT